MSEPIPQEEATIHHVSQRQRRRTGNTRMQLNLTSMIDVIFLLLVFFILTLSFTPDEGIISAKLPGGSGVPDTPQAPINELQIALRARGQYDVSIAVRGQPGARNFADLAAQLSKLQRRPDNPNGIYPDDSPVKIKPAPGVRWQHVVNAFNAAVKARYKSISFEQPSE